MRSLAAFSVVTALAAGTTLAAPALDERKVGDKASGLLSVVFRNGTLAGCVDKSFNWASASTVCERFHVVMGRYDGDEGEMPFRMTNSAGWGCYYNIKSYRMVCEKGHAGGWWQNRQVRIPRDGDVIWGGGYGYGVPGTCEVSPLESREKVHEYELPVQLMWTDVVRDATVNAEAKKPTVTRGALRAQAAPDCTSTRTLTATSTHHTFPTDAPFSAHWPGHMNVLHQGKLAGCLTNDGSWTANRDKCGEFKAHKTSVDDPYIDLVTKEGYCAPSFHDEDHIICTYEGVTEGMHVDGFFLVHDKPGAKTWHGSAMPQGDSLETISRTTGGTMEVQVKWETIPINQ